jgi:hypothetical protein
MPIKRNWSREETLLAFRLYCQTPRHRLDRSNAEIVRIAHRLDRTPDAVVMKAFNLAAADPVMIAQGRAGLPHGARLEQQIWDAFFRDSGAVAEEAELAYEALMTNERSPTERPRTRDDQVREPAPPRYDVTGSTETTGEVRLRRVQGFFRRAVLTSYANRCAVTGLEVDKLLNASHIIPWATSEPRRADPRNGICLNTLHDRAFDRGLITFDEDHRIVISPELRHQTLGSTRDLLIGTEGHPLLLPARFAPDAAAMDHQRTQIFIAA